MDKMQPILVLAFRAVTLALAAVSLALVVLGTTTTAIVTLALKTSRTPYAGLARHGIPAESPTVQSD